MTALIQADRYGTSVGTSLRVMAEEGRETRMMEAEKKAASLPPKLTVPLILFFLPVLFIVIISPAMIRSSRRTAASAQCYGELRAETPQRAPREAQLVSGVKWRCGARPLSALDQVPAVLLGQQRPDIGHVGLDLVGWQFGREQRRGSRRTAPADRRPGPGSAAPGCWRRASSRPSADRLGLVELVGHGVGEAEIGVDRGLVRRDHQRLPVERRAHRHCCRSGRGWRP